MDGSTGCHARPSLTTRAIPHDDVHLHIHQEDGVGGGVEQGAVARCALPQGLLRLPPGGDVDIGAPVPQEVTPFVQEGNAAGGKLDGFGRLYAGLGLRNPRNCVWTANAAKKRRSSVLPAHPGEKNHKKYLPRDFLRFISQ